MARFTARICTFILLTNADGDCILLKHSQPLEMRIGLNFMHGEIFISMICAILDSCCQRFRRACIPTHVRISRIRIPRSSSLIANYQREIAITMRTVCSFEAIIIQEQHFLFSNPSCSRTQHTASFILKVSATKPMIVRRE